MPKLKMSDILELSVAERIQLVQDIWDSIAQVPESLDLTQDQKEELDRRLENLQKNPSSAVPWEELKTRIGLRPVQVI